MKMLKLMIQSILVGGGLLLFCNPSWANSDLDKLTEQALSAQAPAKNSAVAMNEDKRAQLQQQLAAMLSQVQAVPTAQTANTAPSNPPGTVVASAEPTTSAPAAENPTATVDAPADPADVASEQAFLETLRTLMPLSPDQIKTLHYLYDQTRKAAAQPAGVPPKPTSSSVPVNLAPGASPPVVRLSSGFITSLVFVDATGAPWPIQSYDIGDPKSYNVQWDQKGSTLWIQALSQYQSANLAVMLQGLNTPVMVTLLAGQQSVDYRVDLRMPQLGPNAQVTMSNLPSTGNPELLNILDGVPPANSKTLQVAGGEAEAWLIGKKLFLRTRMTVTSPAWMSTMSSPDGMHAYELQQSPVILALSHGTLVKLTVEGL